MCDTEVGAVYCNHFLRKLLPSNEKIANTNNGFKLITLNGTHVYRSRRLTGSRLKVQPPIGNTNWQNSYSLWLLLSFCIDITFELTPSDPYQAAATIFRKVLFWEDNEDNDKNVQVLPGGWGRRMWTEVGHRESGKILYFGEFLEITNNCRPFYYTYKQ